MNTLRHPTRPQPVRRRGRQRGVSMIEVLVTVLIFSFGMLGLAGLQLRTMAHSQASLFRSQATALTDDVLDRMRASRGTAASWATDFDGTGTAGTDLADWKSEVAGLLPDGKAAISLTATKVTVTIRWNDAPDKSETEPTEFTTVTVL